MLLCIGAALIAVLLFPPDHVIGSALGDSQVMPGGIQQDTTRRDTTQPRSQGGKAPLDSLQRVARPDSLGRVPGRRDTVSLKSLITDTTYVVYKDSSARLRQWTYMRRDHPYVSIFPGISSPLYATPRSPAYKREVIIDSTTLLMEFRETYGGVEVKIPVNISMNDYITERRAREFRRLLTEEARKPKAVMKKDDLGELLSNVTQITIPVPPNPIFSIFGKNEIKLNISGSVDIKAGFRNTKSDYTTLSSLDQSRNEPDFSQDVQVNVNGTIGDKLNILADWNTKRTFEYENQLKIKYTGYDDEIVKSVEAGNVSLQTPSSFIGSSQALFGVKAMFQMGPLTLTALASQKKGQIKEVAVSGGSKEQTFEFRAFEYSTNHYFVDTSYIKTYEPYFQNDPPIVDGNAQIIEEEVWIQRQGGVPDPQERQGVCFISLPERGQGYADTLRNLIDLPGQIETGPFVRLDRSQYELDGEAYIGVLSLNVNVGDQQIVAISYRRRDNSQFGELVRDIGTDSLSLKKKLILKMVKPKNLVSNGPTYPVAWRMLLKNIYPIPGIGRNLKESGFSLDVYRKIPGSEDQNSVLNEPLLRVMGVDRYRQDGTADPNGDGKFDFRPGRTISLTRAEIIFPTLRPFDTGIKTYFGAKGTIIQDTSDYLYKEVYDTTQTFAQQSLRNRYTIRGKATGEATSRYSLGFNVVEGSVQVLLDGRTLVQNIDYTVDYIIGEVVIKNDRALVPGASLQIKYEQNDLFQLASKTLLGARGDLALSPTTNLGFTIMNLNQQTLSDKVRLGEEPNMNTIFGIDGATTIDMPFLTKAIDALPLIQTREVSSLKVSGEAAYMSPDPNTKKSTIPSDGGQGIAYIDDFEGARRFIPVGVSYGAWTQASPPGDSYWFPGLADTSKMFSKAKMIWYNILPTNVKLTDVYPNKKPGNDANNQVTVLDLHYFPTTRGQFNYGMDVENTLTRFKNWGGVMKPLSISAINLLKENVNFIEIWMRVDRAPADPSARMVIDLGVISEDAIPNRSLNSEDLVLSPIPNGTLQEGEDVGLDMMNDDQERARYAALVAKYPELAGDPSGDNYAYNNSSPTEDFMHINGTDGNKDGPGGRIPDTEDLNANGQVDLANAYLEYELSLDTVASRNPRIVGGGNKGWFQFRIPINDTTRVVGRPSLENIEFVRVSFVNATDTIAVRIADFNLVGNQWQKYQKDLTDTSYSVTVVNVEDNLYYQSPPGVIRERDKTRPDENVLANEQSLSLVLYGLVDGESRQAVKFFTYKALDLFNYKTMKMFVHGDPSFQYVDENNYDAEVFYRFGLDSLNFYEYRAPIRPRPDNQGWDEIVVNFDDLTAIKQGRDSTTALSPPVPVKGGPPGAVYRVLGSPSLTQIVYLALGVENPRGKGTVLPLRGAVWFNELRLIGVDDTPGWAYRFDAQLKLADIGAVAMNYQKVDPYFHRLEDRFGSRQLTTNWGLSASISMERLLPDSWIGSSIPFSYSHNEGMVEPRYLPNSDVLVTQASQLLEEHLIQTGTSEEEAKAKGNELVSATLTRRVTETYAAPNFRIALPSQWWLIRDTFNKLTYGFTYNTARDQSPAVRSHQAWSWNVRLGYALTLSPDNFLMPFKYIFDGAWFLDEYKNLKLFFAPSSLTWSIGATRGRDNSLQRVQGANEIISRNFTASRGLGFSWKFAEGGLLNLQDDYSLQIESTLLQYETGPEGNQRPFSDIMGDIFGGSRLINFGQDIRYSQRNQFSFKPGLPNIFNTKRFYDITFGYSVDYSWINTLLKGDLGKSAAFNNTANLTLNIKLKQIFDPLFDTKPGSQGQQPTTGRRGSGAAPQAGDSLRAADTIKTVSTGSKVTLQLKNLVVTFIKIPFLDYDNISVNFSQSNNSQNSGVVGGTGFLNYWGRLPFADPVTSYGPSRMYQLGLISVPSGTLTNFHAKGEFPFFGWDVAPGPRAPGGVLIDSYRQNNRVGLKTSRALWEGARIDFNWSLGWTYNRTNNVATDSVYGIPTITNSMTSGSIDRSFLTFPDFLFFSMFKTGLTQVSKLYGEMKSDVSDTRADEEKLADAFQRGFEAIPILRKLLGEYYPRINWSLRWDGLEKLGLFSGFVSRLSLDHVYSSNFTKQFQTPQNAAGQRTDAERVSYGFSPLVGLNFTFKELAKGNFGANVRYNTTTSYDLATSARNIVESISQELSLTASYARKGFEIPFFGLALNNDVDVSLSYSVNKTSRKTYDVTRLDVSVTAVPLEGMTRTILEPRIRYVLSSRVTAAVYYKLTKVAPDDSGSRIPGSTVNEAGLDIRISIQ